MKEILFRPMSVPRQNRQVQGRSVNVEDREMLHRRQIADAHEHFEWLYEADWLVVVEA